MGGFDFSLTQRYHLSHLETSFWKRKRQSSHFPTKRQELPSSEWSSKEVSCSLQTPAQPEARSSLKRTARRSTISHQISTHAVPEPQQTHSSSTSSCRPISNYNASTQVDKPESAHTSPQPPVFCTDTKANSGLTSLWEAMTYSGGIWWCSVLKESKYLII